MSTMSRREKTGLEPPIRRKRVRVSCVLVAERCTVRAHCVALRTEHYGFHFSGLTLELNCLETIRSEGICRDRSSTETSVIDETHSSRWTAFIKRTHLPLMKGLLAVARVSAIHPKKTIVTCINISLMLLLSGYFTNFNVGVDERILWTPKGSLPIQHWQRIKEAGFPGGSKYFVAFFHANGDNVVSKDYVSKVFQVMDTVRNSTHYDAVCADGDRMAANGILEVEEGQNATCEISGIPAFWGYQQSIFEQQVQTDEDVSTSLSSNFFPDFRPVPRSLIMGNYEVDDDSGLLTKVQSFTLAFHLPQTDQAQDWGLNMVDVVLNLKDQWISEGSNFRVECTSDGAFALEFTRAILQDIPLVPIVFLIMSGFTALVFWKRHKVQSRSVIGVAAVVAVLLSIMSGYGLLFIIGVPFTSMTQLLPFLLFGKFTTAAPSQPLIKDDLTHF